MKKVLLACMLLCSAMYSSAQLAQHGLLLNGGFGNIDAKIEKPGFAWQTLEYKSGFSIGYRLRFKKPAPQAFHFDIDMNAGSKFLEWKQEGSREFAQNSFLSIGGTANYSLIKNLSAGLGIEPLYYCQAYMDVFKTKFDIPVVAKIACNLKFVELAIYGKYGLINVFETNHLKKGNLGELQLSVFIPFKSL
jgi:hypothetical protein